MEVFPFSKIPSSIGQNFLGLSGILAPWDSILIEFDDCSGSPGHE